MKNRFKIISSFIISASILIGSAGCGNGSNNANVTLDNAVDNMLKNMEEGKKARETDYQEVKIGDTVEKEFIKITIKDAGTSDSIFKKGDQETGTRLDYEAKDVENETYFWFLADVKNTGSNNISTSDIETTFVINEKYNYRGHEMVIQVLSPFKSGEEYYYVSVPDELAKSFTSCKIRFGFGENMECNFKETSWQDYRYEFDLK